MKQKKKRQGRSCSIGNATWGGDSKIWGKLNKGNEEKRIFHLLHQRKSTDFSGVTVTFVQSSVLKENNKERFKGEKKVSERKYTDFRKEREILTEYKKNNPNDLYKTLFPFLLHFSSCFFKLTTSKQIFF